MKAKSKNIKVTKKDELSDLKRWREYWQARALKAEEEINWIHRRYRGTCLTSAERTIEIKLRYYELGLICNAVRSDTKAAHVCGDVVFLDLEMLSFYLDDLRDKAIKEKKP